MSKGGKTVVSSAGDFIDLIITLSMIEPADELGRKKVVQKLDIFTPDSWENHFSIFFVLLELDFPSHVSWCFISSPFQCLFQFVYLSVLKSAQPFLPLPRNQIDSVLFNKSFDDHVVKKRQRLFNMFDNFSISLSFSQPSGAFYQFSHPFTSLSRSVEEQWM